MKLSSSRISAANSGSRWRSVSIVIALTLVLALVIVNVHLATSNKALRKRWMSYFGATVAAGDRLITVVGIDRAGARFVTDVRDQKLGTLIFTMSIWCPACKASIEKWERLRKRATDQGILALTISKDWYPDLIIAPEAAQIGGTLISDPTSGTFQSLRMNAVPQLVFVDRTGRVTKAWVGALGESHEREMSEFLSVIGKVAG